MDSIRIAKALRARVRTLANQILLVSKKTQYGVDRTDLAGGLNKVSVKNVTLYPTGQDIYNCGNLADMSFRVAILCHDTSPGARTEYVHDKAFGDALAQVLVDRMPMLMKDVQNVLTDSATQHYDRAVAELEQAKQSIEEMRHERA